MTYNRVLSVRGRFLREDGTMDMPKLRAALDLPTYVDLADLNFLVPRSVSVSVTTATWTLTVEVHR
ncbi:hypothetical protein AWC04_08445 [Mycolicibacterium fallax]|uniref:Uncharacterized protein n=1 Tax=Mycolicibacterium fallax TaxID=1793 RepID=A0A1X1RFL1_MYCFA|nr:hypothetical protein AWC04_08445 [Mycolicibacterium fallax]